MSDAKAATTCKRLEAELKGLRARIRRLTSMAPGPARQQERLFICADLSALGARIYGVVESIMEEPSDKKVAGPSESENHHGVAPRFVSVVAGRKINATRNAQHATPQ